MKLPSLLPRFSVLSLLCGLLLASASLTPSLIPRDMLFQGGASGGAAASGYLVMRFGLALWHALEIPVLTGRTARLALTLLAIPVFSVLVLCVAQAADWQSSIRLRMGLPELEAINTLKIIAIALVVFLVLS